MARIGSICSSALLTTVVLFERTPAKLKMVAVAVTALLVFGATYALASGGHHRPVVYTVKPYDTVWTIAADHYSRDPRGAVYSIAQANHLHDYLIRPGQKLQLP